MMDRRTDDVCLEGSDGQTKGARWEEGIADSTWLELKERQTGGDVWRSTEFD
jgi:hypothetical protein